MEVLTSILNFFDTVLWSSPLIYISIFVGLLYTVGLKGFQVRYLKQMVNSVFEKSADSGCGLWQFWERQHLLQKIR